VSALTCGCDVEAGWTCLQHQSPATFAVYRLTRDSESECLVENLTEADAKATAREWNAEAVKEGRRSGGQEFTYEVVDRQMPMRTVCMFEDCSAVIVDLAADARGISHGLCPWHREHYDEACQEIADQRQEAIDAGEVIE